MTWFQMEGKKEKLYQKHGWLSAVQLMFLLFFFPPPSQFSHSLCFQYSLWSFSYKKNKWTQTRQRWARRSLENTDVYQAES